MAAITASMVGALRAKTDAPMMECKKALTEAEGNMERSSPTMLAVIAAILSSPLGPNRHTRGGSNSVCLWKKRG